jgi:poly(3-hydroxyalkanoate) synthetase
MITLLEELIEHADGSYANAKDIRALEHLMSSWPERKEAYLEIQAKEESIVERAIKLMRAEKVLSDLDMSQIQGRCRRDMTSTIRSYALAMLLQDEEMLKDRVLYWQKNIYQAMGLDCHEGCRFLLESIYLELPVKQADLFKPYFKIAGEMIGSRN